MPSDENVAPGNVQNKVPNTFGVGYPKPPFLAPAVPPNRRAVPSAPFTGSDQPYSSRILRFDAAGEQILEISGSSLTFQVVQYDESGTAGPSPDGTYHIALNELQPFASLETSGATAVLSGTGGDQDGPIALPMWLHLSNVNYYKVRVKCVNLKQAPQFIRVTSWTNPIDIRGSKV